MKINLKRKENKTITKRFTLPAVLLCSVFALVFLSILLTPTQSQAATKTWDSGGANDNCSTAGNWDADTAPIATDDIVINSTADAIIWDASCPQTVNSFLMDTGFTGSVQVNTVYGASGFTVFTITTNLTINAGTMKHADNSTAETYRLNLSVGGDFTLGASGTINVDGKGYLGGSGPSGTGMSPQAGSYGGRGPRPSGEGLTYGSITAPINIGSGGYGLFGPSSNGGGAIQLMVNSQAIINGIISSTGVLLAGGPNGSGGSIYITTNTLSGSTGSISANGGGGTTRGGGGGRISLILTGALSHFNDYSGSITCYGGGGGIIGAAGTVYKETYAQHSLGSGYGDLIINNNNQSTYDGIDTSISSLVTDTTVGSSH